MSRSNLVVGAIIKDEYALQILEQVLENHVYVLMIMNKSIKLIHSTGAIILHIIA